MTETGTVGTISASFGHRLVELREDSGRTRQCRLGPGVGPAVAGDEVSAIDGELVTALRARRSLLLRFSASGRARPAVANAAQLLLLLAPHPNPLPALIDHCLATAELSGIAALLIVNKSDLEDADATAPLLARYRSCGYPQLHCSALRGDGLDALRTQLSGKSSVLVGQSGVGKTTLLNHLSGADDITHALSARSSRGTHTTSVTRGYPLPGGGWLFDMPGIQDCSLAHVGTERLASAYAEFRPFLGRCRFHNCRHNREPGCALGTAAAAGEISIERLESYRHCLRTQQPKQS